MSISVKFVDFNSIQQLIQAEEPTATFGWTGEFFLKTETSCEVLDIEDIYNHHVFDEMKCIFSEPQDTWF